LCFLVSTRRTRIKSILFFILFYRYNTYTHSNSLLL
jgi:hypothetical protein